MSLPRSSQLVQVGIVGLTGLKYLDNTNNMAEGKEEAQILRFHGELDRVYVQTPKSLQAWT